MTHDFEDKYFFIKYKIIKIQKPEISKLNIAHTFHPNKHPTSKVGVVSSALLVHIGDFRGLYQEPKELELLVFLLNSFR
jgi:hypothetical protein